MLIRPLISERYMHKTKFSHPTILPIILTIGPKAETVHGLLILQGVVVRIRSA